MTVQESNTFSGLDAGFYTVTVIDDNGCTFTLTAEVESPTLLVATAMHRDLSCFGSADGTIVVTATGGTTPYEYSLDGGMTTQASNVFNGLDAGDYTVTVIDANGCEATVSVTIAEPTELSVATSGSDASCAGSANGTATATPAGGTPGYSYLWSNGSTDQTAMGLAAGTYTVTVTDANGCTAEGSVTIDQPDALTGTASATSVSCNGGADGTATAEVTGGTGDYSYLWSSGSTSQTATGLSAGGYAVTVTDENGCTLVLAVTVSQPALLLATAITADVSCAGGADGSITVTPTGGTPDYTYSLDGGTPQASNTFSGLSAGTYTIVVMDANGCSFTLTAEVEAPTLLTIATTHTDVSCAGGADGSITVFANGGTTPYSYDAGAGTVSGNVISSLAAGFYTVTVTDANGCMATSIVVIAQPSALSVALSATDAACFGNADGTASAMPAGGTPGYSYLWSNGSTDQTAMGLAAGTYTVTVTDANGCTAEGSIMVGEPDALTATASQEEAESCPGAADGSATVVAFGGSKPYAYTWDFAAGGQETATAIGLSVGIYTVTVTDANGCTATASVQVLLGDTEGPVFASCPDNIELFTTETTCDAVTDILIPNVSDNCGVASYTISFGNGMPVPAFVPLGGLVEQGNTLSLKFSQGVTVVTLTATDVSGIASTCTFLVEVVDNVPPVAICQDITVQLDSLGTASIVAEDLDGGSFDNCGIASFELALGADSFGCADVGENTITLTVTDVNGNTSTCEAIVTVEDNVPPVALCIEELVVYLDDEGLATIAVEDIDAGSGDACGLASLYLDVMSFNCDDLGPNLVTLRAEDVNGNVATCEATVIVRDSIAPVIVCLERAVIEFNGEDSIALSLELLLDLEGSFDNCGELFLGNATPAYVYCEDLGENIAVEITVEDASGNTATCETTVAVEGLPCGFIQPDDVNCGPNSQVDYDPLTEQFTLSGDCFNGDTAQDSMTYVYQEFCGDGEITAHIIAVQPLTYAGVKVRETNYAGAKMVGSFSNRGSVIRWDTRYETDEPKIINLFSRPLPYWLRLRRQGDTFFGFYSIDGINWQLVNIVTVEMEECVEFGLGAFNIVPGTPYEAVFGSVSIVPLAPMMAVDVPNNEVAPQAAARESLNIELFPNPTRDRVRLVFSEEVEQPTVMRLRNQWGQLIEQRRLEVPATNTEWEVSNLPAGLYHIEIQPEGAPLQVLRFVKAD
jgi:uncharacterized protein (DUF2141 family)